jgi:predicted transposase YbfD/YdcC
MTQFTAQTIPDKPAVFHSLTDYLRTIPDQRCDQGKRFELAYLLGIVLLGFLKGKTSVEACVSFATARKKWFSRWFDITHGVPDATTIGRACATTIPQDLIRVVNQFMESIEGIIIETGVSIDGKTIKAISELKDGCRHFISLFSHTTCRILDQEGVVKKENEITATPRLLNRQVLVGTMVTADALLTQTKITQAIRDSGGDYLLVVKGNHPDLQQVLAPTFTDPLTRKSVGIFYETRKTRQIETVITTTRDVDLNDLHHQGWQNIALVGRLERRGVRTTKRAVEEVNETLYFITSRKGLTPKAAYQFLRNHWHVENKLHWQKDVTWKEDRQRTKSGQAPSILSYFRSLALQCIRQKYTSTTQAIEQFTERPQTYFSLLTSLKIV